MLSVSKECHEKYKSTPSHESITVRYMAVGPILYTRLKQVAMHGRHIWPNNIVKRKINGSFESGHQIQYKLYIG